MAKIFIVILNWNRFKDTQECLDSVQKLETTSFKLEIVVVDNASTDDSVEQIKSYTAENKKKIFPIHLIENQENVGFAAGNNLGINFALAKGADWVMVLNNDTIVDKNLVVRLLEAVKKGKKVGAASPKMYFARGFEFHQKRYKKADLGKVIWYAGGEMDWNNVYGSCRGVDQVDKGQFNKVEETDFATGTCMFLNSQALEDVGLFDENYFFYYEDNDLSQRMKKAGWRLLYIPQAVIWHKVSQSSGIGSELNDYYTTRNRMFFGMLYASLQSRIALIRESFYLFLKGRKWQKIGIRDYYLGRFGRGSWKDEK